MKSRQESVSCKVTAFFFRNNKETFLDFTRRLYMFVCVHMRVHALPPTDMHLLYNLNMATCIHTSKDLLEQKHFSSLAKAAVY